MEKLQEVVTELGDLKIVLNVRDKRYISLLEQIKEEAGINYQNLIKMGILLLFRDEAKKIEQFKKEQAAEQQAQAQPQVKESILSEQYESGLLKVHITFTGRLRKTIEIWKYRTGKTPQDIARIGLTRIFSFFEREDIVDKPLSIAQEDIKQKVSLLKFLDEEEKDNLMSYIETVDKKINEGAIKSKDAINKEIKILEEKRKELGMITAEINKNIEALNKMAVK